MKVVAFLPIKLNSQRIPHKNKLLIAGHPLCWHLTNTLCNVKSIDEVYVFCSDEEVVDYIPDNARFLKRDKYYDGDKVKSYELISRFIEEVPAEIYVFANTTSPFVRVDTIENALSRVLSGEYDSALTVLEFKTFARYKNEPINYDINDIPRTQDIEPVFIETSGFYIFEKEIFSKYHRRVGFNPYLQVVDNIEAIDIDTPEDLEFARIIADSVLK